eukprot:COSAG01_NODE_6_length_54687_cov_500.907599_28_plen_675_part_00
MTKYRNSLRRKILLPFLILMLILSLILMAGILHVVSDIKMKDYETLLSKDQRVIERWLQEEKQKQLNLNQQLPSLRWRALRRLQREDHRNKDQNQVYTQVSDMPERFQVAAGDLLSQASKDARFEPCFIFYKQHHELLFLAGLKLQAQDQDFIFLNSRLIEDTDLEQLPLSSDSALFQVNTEISEPIVMSGRIYSDPVLQDALCKLLSKKNKAIKRVHHLNLESQSFLVYFNHSYLHPHLFTLVLTEKTPVFANSWHLIFIIFGLIILSCLLIYAIYAMIIGKIITSIDVLSDVAMRVSKGDLEQKVYLSSKDEIGRLSTIFNQMIKNLKRSSHDLMQEKQQSETVLNNVAVGILVTNTSYELNLANREAEKLFAFKTKSQDAQKFLEFLSRQSLFNNKGSKLINLSYEDEWQGQVRLFELCAQVLHHEGNARLLIVIRDLTHEKEVERLRDAFLRTVTHELRTPLTSVIGYIELVQQGGDKKKDKAHKEYLNTALKEAQTLQQLIDDLLDLSQLNAGKIKMIYSTIDVAVFIDDVIKSLQPLLKNKKLSLKNAFKKKDFELRADRNKLRRILMNLCSNAIKFTPKGSVTIDCVEHEDNLAFSVKDTGIGLKEDQQDIIFEHFRQVDDSSTRQYQGTGLGLAIVRELVELHEGQIKVDSTYGQGSTFTFTIKKK